MYIPQNKLVQRCPFKFCTDVPSLRLCVQSGGAAFSALEPLKVLQSEEAVSLTVCDATYSTVYCLQRTVLDTAGL